MVINLLREGVPIAVIAKAAGMSIADLTELQRQHGL
jgi:hypothetical protein